MPHRALRQILIQTVLSVLLLSSAARADEVALELSEDERAWIAAHASIRVANEMDWPPFDFVDERGQAAGFSIDYFKLLAAKAGLKVEWVNGYSWQELLQMGREDRIDVFPAIILNDERDRFLDFTEPYLENVVGYFVRDDFSAIKITRAQELAGYRLALVKGFDNHRTILKLLPDVSRVEVDSSLEGLKAVMTDEADIFIEDTAVGNYLIKKHLLRDIQVAGGVKLPQLFETTQIRIAVRDDLAELNAILSKAMAAVSEQEIQALRNRWLELPPQPLLTRERLIALIVIAVVTVLLLALAWIWGLRRQRNRLLHEMQQQTRALNESERRLALALQGGGMAAWDMDLASGSMVLSRGWWQMLGLQEDTTKSPRQAWLHNIHPDDRVRVLAAEEAYRQGTLSRYEVEYRVRCDGGDKRWHLAIGAGMDHDRAGRPTRMLGLIQDITERKRLARMKDEFVASVSHELRTPLTSIKGSLGLLLGGAAGEVSADALRLLHIAHDNCDRLLLLINDLLDIDKIQAGKFELHRAPLSLRELCQKALLANQGYAGKFAVKLVCDIASLPALELKADEQRLLQVLANLLSNAIKFSPKGEPVELTAIHAEGAIQIVISDHGPGISKQFQAKLFQPFSQEDSSDSRRRGGTGLGLAISKRLVEAHGGTIVCDSEPGRGCRFIVTLPLE